jgi:hypothetical protein
MENKVMKLADWARKQGIAYLTAYRWFKDGKLPVKAYQSDSGTIIVDDDDTSEQPMSNPIGTQNSDIFTHILKKVVEFRNNNATIEEFAGYVLSNFSLKLNSGTDSPRYSKNKPKEEDIQKHFQQFIPKREKPKPNMFFTKEDDLNELLDESLERDDMFLTKEDGLNELFDESLKRDENNIQSSRDCAIKPRDDSGLYQELVDVFSTKSCNVGGTGSGIPVTMNLTPRNYTSSTDLNSRSLSLSEPQSTILSRISSVNDCEEVSDIINMGPTGAFKPTQKEIESAKETFKAVGAPLRRRGRKPTKNLGKK